MADLYFWPTGNGKKIVISLAELGCLTRSNQSALTAISARRQS